MRTTQVPCNILTSGILWGGARACAVRLKIDHYAVRGFALGLASHGIGMTHAFAVSPVADAFASITMALNGIATSLLVPAVFDLF